MATVLPFSALRFSAKAGDAAALVCPPYDIISETQRRQYLAENPHNIVRLELPFGGADPYATAGGTLAQWLADGILTRDRSPAFYVYRIGFMTPAGTESEVTGLIARVGLAPFSKGIVLPHEETLSKAKTDRFNLMTATNCNFSQIYSLYRATPGAPSADSLVAGSEPLTAIRDGAGLTHTVWALTDPEVCAAISASFADTKLYIADGHHRYETALNYQAALRGRGVDNPAADCVMMMLVDMDHPGLLVLPTHRVVRKLAGFDSAALLKKCAGAFDVEAVPAEHLERCCAESAGHVLGYTDGQGSYKLTLRDAGVMDTLLPASSAAYRGLDVNILHLLVLERFLGIDKENMANQINLTYTRDWEAAAAAAAEDADCAFRLNPTKVAEIRDVAAAGEKMPQKSTYFYPKLITGLVMNQLSD